MTIAVKSLPSYSPQALPVIAGGEGRYAQNELQSIKDVLAAYSVCLPQAANKAPTAPSDGMIRLSRDPWRPVSGQTTDQWVYWDAAGSVWRLLATAPTNT